MDSILETTTRGWRVVLVSGYSDSIGPIMTAALRAGSSLNQSPPNTPRPPKEARNI